LLTLLTLGALWPWREAALERYKMKHCYYGDLEGSFEGRGSALFKRGWKFWLMAILPLILGLVAVVLKAVSSVPPGGGVVVGLLLVVWVFALPFIYGAFKAIEWRWWISGVRFGEVSFESDLPSGALYGLYWKVIGWYLLVSLAFSIYIAICGAVILGYGDMAHFAVRSQGSIAFTLATVVGYLGIIVALNVAIRVYLLRDVWARVTSSVTVYRLEAAANVAAKGDLADAVGEGLVGGLDVVGF